MGLIDLTGRMGLMGQIGRMCPMGRMGRMGPMGLTGQMGRMGLMGQMGMVLLGDDPSMLMQFGSLSISSRPHRPITTQTHYQTLACSDP